MLKTHIEALLRQAVEQLRADGTVPTEAPVVITVERARDRGHGDFASNLAMTLARPARRPPRELAEALVAALPASDEIDRVEIAGPGFINFFMTPTAFQRAVPEIAEQGEAYGRSDLGAGHPVHLEFVSANPTGPLHVGHGRGAAYGAVVGDLLEAVGYAVHREYYVNDAGRQMDILAVSVWLRYLELCGESVAFPANGYQGDYIFDIAAALHRQHGEAFRHGWPDVDEGLPADAPQGNKEARVDALGERARALLGEDAFRVVLDTALDYILGDIRHDLAAFGVTYQEWFSERSLTDNQIVQRTIEQLREKGHLYEAEGALWFRASQFGDEKDRVVVRENGQPTYFASDIAYHLDKYHRGYETLVDIWGADHHGYVPRIKAAMSALGADPQSLEVLLVQFAILYRGGEKIPMSTRAGEFVTLRQLREEVGGDAARFFYVMRSHEQHLDFDLDLAKSQSADNPVYYIQYAHARVCSVMRQLAQKDLAHDPDNGYENLHRLTESHEQELLVSLSRYPEIIEAAANARAPHQLAHYLRELANAFHTYYNAHTFLVDDAGLRDARLSLILATRQVIANGLSLLGVSAPESM